MGRLLQYRFPGAAPGVDAGRSGRSPPVRPGRETERRPRASAATPVGNLLLAALVAARGAATSRRPSAR